MSNSSRLKLLVFASFAVCGCIWFGSQLHPTYAQADRATSRYAVVESDGTNLIVTDNATHTLFFYAIDRDAHVGSDLKLRGSVDLNEVGKPVLKPKVAN